MNNNKKSATSTRTTTTGGERRMSVRERAALIEKTTTAPAPSSSSSSRSLSATTGVDVNRLANRLSQALGPTIRSPSNPPAVSALPLRSHSSASSVTPTSSPTASSPLPSPSATAPLAVRTPLADRMRDESPPLPSKTLAPLPPAQSPPPPPEKTSTAARWQPFPGRTVLGGKRAEEYRLACNVPNLDRIAIGAGRLEGLRCAEVAAALVKCTPSFPSKVLNDFARLRVICRWMGANIAYDIDSLYDNRVTHDICEPETVLKRRKSVCSGYASLLAQLCSLAGVTIVKKSGWAKGIDYQVGDPCNVKSNHAWNIVTLDGEAYLLDSTWATGHCNGRSFTRQWNEHYFLTSPEHFLVDHFPDSPTDQLLTPPVTAAEYATVPHFQAAFWRAKMQPVSHFQGVIVAKAGGEEVVMRFLISPHWEIMSPRVELREEGGGRRSRSAVKMEAHAVAGNGPGMALVRVRCPPGPCSCVVQLFACEKSPSGSKHGDWAGDYLLRVESAGSSPMPFPRYYSCGVELSEMTLPDVKQLKLGSTVRFRLRVEDGGNQSQSKAAVVLPGNTWIYMESPNGGGLFQKDIKMTATGTVQLLGGKSKTKGSSSYDVVAEYEVVA